MRPVKQWASVLLLCGLSHATFAAPVWPQGEQAFFAKAEGERMQAWQVNTRSARVQSQNLNDLATPLGSTWKLFVYAYALDKQLPDTPYQCTGGNPEEKYCCEKGGSIGRDKALLQSCGLYFQPQRLGITEQDWRYYWYLQRAPLWLTELDNLREDTVLPVRDVLWALQQVPSAPKQQAEQVLLNVWLRSDNSHSLNPLGSTWRGKTLTMPHPLNAKQRIGGMAGWNTQGEAFWLLARGNSHEVLQGSGAWLPKLSEQWQTAAATPSPKTGLQAACVEVDYLAFMTNPIVSVKRADTGQAVYGGVLPSGKYVVGLKNGRQVALQSVGDISVFAQEQHYRLRARMDMNEYVARVLEREAAAVPEQAAKALSIAIRTYALNEASGSGACLLMRDTTQQQRVLTQAASSTTSTTSAQASACCAKGAGKGGVSSRTTVGSGTSNACNCCASQGAARGSGAAHGPCASKRTPSAFSTAASPNQPPACTALCHPVGGCSRMPRYRPRVFCALNSSATTGCPRSANNAALCATKVVHPTPPRAETKATVRMAYSACPGARSAGMR